MAEERTQSWSGLKLAHSAAEEFGGKSSLRADLEIASRWRAPDAMVIDGLIREEAGRHFARVRSMRAVVRRQRWSSLAAAAALAFSALVAVWLGQRDASPMLAGDITRDRRVDILDAFALARRIEAGQPLASTLDFDGDGRVNQRDVDALASSAVSLDLEASSNARASAELPGRSGS